MQTNLGKSESISRGFQESQIRVADYLRGFVEKIRQIQEGGLTLNFAIMSIEEEINRVEDASVFLILTGPMRVGKSLLTNLLAAADVSVVRSGAVTTAVVTQIKYGPKKKGTVYFKNLDRQPLVFNPDNEEELSRYTTVMAGSDLTADIDLVVIESPQEGLRGLTIMDVPGINDPNQQRGALASRFAARTHAIIYLVPVGASVTIHDLNFIKEYREKSAFPENWDDLFVLVNRIDEKIDADGKIDMKAVAAIREHLVQAMVAEGINAPEIEPHIYEVSSFWTQRSREIGDSGHYKDFDDLANRDRRFRQTYEEVFREVVEGYSKFEKDLKAHLSRQDFRARIFLKPIRDVQRHLQNQLLGIKAKEIEMEKDVTELKGRVVYYKKLAANVETKRQKTLDDAQKRLIQLIGEALDNYAVTSLELVSKTTRLACNSVLERLNKIDGKNGGLSKTEKAEFVEEIEREVTAGIADVQGNVVTLWVDAMEEIFATIEADLNDVAKKIRENLQDEINKDEDLKLIFEAFRLPQLENLDDSISELLTAGMPRTFQETEGVFRSVKISGNGKYVGGGFGALLGGIIGFLFGGPIGGGIGAGIGGGGGAILGDDESEILEISTDWRSKVLGNTEAKLKDHMKKTLRTSEARLINNPLAKIEADFSDKIIKPVFSSLTQHLQSITEAVEAASQNRESLERQKKLIKTQGQMLEKLLAEAQSLDSEIRNAKS